MIPTPHTVQREAFTPGATDAHGNPVDAWDAPVTVAVHGWADPTPDDLPGEANRAAVVRDRDLYAPAGTVSNPRDRWTLPDGVFESQGYARDYAHGPWPWAGAGVVVYLLRVEG